MGFERSAKPDVPAPLSFLSDTRFVLCVGTIEHRKNGVALLEAWRKLIEELGDQVPLLVFAGKYGTGGAEFQAYLTQHGELSRYVDVIHAPSDSDLAWLYQSCLFTTLPSLIEGWGLPVGESAWFDKFCVASHATSIPEVCGDLMDYVDPNDVESIRAGLRRPITDPAYLRQREIGIVQAPLRRWFDVAEDIYRCAIAAGQSAP
jgi:glycosyltransferase involved in cell wall biosynthesis